MLQNSLKYSQSQSGLNGEKIRTHLFLELVIKLTQSSEKNEYINRKYTLTHYLADFINLLNFSHFYLNFELILRLVPKINVSQFFPHSNQTDSASILSYFEAFS